MDMNIILVPFLISIILYFLYLIARDDEYISQNKCPGNGGKTKYTACIHDPLLNNGFVVSLSSIKMVMEIQGSLNNADEKYTVHKINGDYFLKNNKNKNEQKLLICTNKNIQYIKDKLNTKSTQVSV